VGTIYYLVDNVPDNYIGEAIAADLLTCKPIAGIKWFTA